MCYHLFSSQLGLGWYFQNRAAISDIRQKQFLASGDRDVKLPVRLVAPGDSWGARVGREERGFGFHDSLQSPAVTRPLAPRQRSADSPRAVMEVITRLESSSVSTLCAPEQHNRPELELLPLNLSGLLLNKKAPSFGTVQSPGKCRSVSCLCKYSPKH